MLQLGERLKRLRKQQGMSSVAFAQRIGISRTTLAAVEAGDLTPAIGTYLRVMSALGVSSELALLGSGALTKGHDTDSRTSKQAEQLSIVVKASDSAHNIQDLQSLMLNKEAVRLIQKDPTLILLAKNVLEQWRMSPNQHAQFLWDEWSVILHRQEWRRALSTSSRGKELRQASPLPSILPPETRAEVLRQVSLLKKGVVLGSPTLAQSKKSTRQSNPGPTL